MNTIGNHDGQGREGLICLYSGLSYPKKWSLKRGGLPKLEVGGTKILSLYVSMVIYNSTTLVSQKRWSFKEGVSQKGGHTQEGSLRRSIIHG